MPIVSADQLMKIEELLLMSAGASKREAKIVATHSVNANLAGHDSHGIIQIPVYIDRIQRGHIVPGAPINIVKETDVTSVIDGNWGFGYVVSEKAMKLTIEKAKKHGVAATTVFRQSHVGRLTDYPLMACKEGLIAIMTADSGRTAKNVAPYGGRASRLGTNPICIAIPSHLDGPMFIDFASSAVASGKISVAIAKGDSIPEGWIINSEGNPTTNPNDLALGGTQLPLGGTEAHKGYGLSVMIEILSGILPGLGFGHDPSGRHNDGCFMAVFDVSAFHPLQSFKKEVTDFAKYLKETPKAQGFEEIYYPGELEHINTEKLKANGISVDDNTWDSLHKIAVFYNVERELECINEKKES